MVVDFREDMHFPPGMPIPERMKKVMGSRRSLGPAARLVTFNEEGFGEPFWVFRDLPGMGQEERPYRIVLKDLGLIQYTGLQAVKDPGVPLVWIGCTFLIIGFLIALLMDHEIVWVTGEGSEHNAYSVRLAGRAVRHPGVYAARFDRQKERLRKGLSPWLES